MGLSYDCTMEVYFASEKDLQTATKTPVHYNDWQGYPVIRDGKYFLAFDSQGYGLIEYDGLEYTLKYIKETYGVTPVAIQQQFTNCQGYDHNGQWLLLVNPDGTTLYDEAEFTDEESHDWDDSDMTSWYECQTTQAQRLQETFALYS